MNKIKLDKRQWIMIPCFGFQKYKHHSSLDKKVIRWTEDKEVNENLNQGWIHIWEDSLVLENPSCFLYQPINRYKNINQDSFDVSLDWINYRKQIFCWIDF